MARFKVTHSTDACCIDIRGNPQNPEPHTAIIKFPGGYVEVSRTSSGEYWAHIQCFQPGGEETPGRIMESRIDYTYQAYVKHGGHIPEIPAGEFIQHIAIKVAV